MRDLQEVGKQELKWTPARNAKNAYELRAGDEVVGTLGWQRGTLAEAVMAAGHWTFKREGFWHPRVTVRIAGSATDLAIFRPSWSGSGSLELSPTRRIQWSAANMWHSQWVWQEEKGAPLLRFTSKQGWTKHEGNVTIERQSGEMALLVALGWYLLVLLAKDTTAATVATTAAVT